MSLVFLLLTLALQAPPTPLVGEWHHVDVRSVETLQNGGCVRVWLEERKYLLQPLPDSRFQGVYLNVVRAVPVGAASFSTNCKYPDPTSQLAAFQLRTWNVLVSPIAEQRWRVRASPGPGGGEFSTLKSEDFVTQLRPVGGRVFDGTGTVDDDNEVLVFHSPASSSAEARAMLQTAVAKLNSGGCLEVIGALPTKKETVAEVCAVRQQLVELLGPFISMSVNAETEFDRVPAGFDSPGKSGFRRQRGVLFELTGTYANARVPGNAIAYEEDGKWRLAALWF